MLGMLDVRTKFGDDLRAGWPMPTFTGTPAEHEGAAAYEAGKAPADNPHEEGTSPALQWANGYKNAASPWYDNELMKANLVSLVRLCVGFLASVALGTLLGLLMWRFLELDKLLGPVFLGMQTLPSVCWVPVAVLVFGINETGILFVLIMGSFFAVAIAMRDGLRVIPPLYQHAGRMMGAHGWKLYRYVLLPASLPALAGSLRTGFSFAWRSLMGAELILFARNHGVGYLLHTGRETNDLAQVMAVLLVMVLVGMMVDRWGFARIQRAVNARFGLATA
jgi:NitT/TauT family transport system permease protein